MPISRISSLEVENFKSLVDFKINLPKFTCLIGLNGAGKSTVLQFIDFLSQLVIGDMQGWLSERKWKSADLKSRLSKKVNIEFCVRFVDESGNPAGRWDADYSPSKHQCTKERLELLDYVLQTTSSEIKVTNVNGSPSEDWKDWRAPITFSYEGSILSALKEELLPPSIRDCKKQLAEIKSLDLLAPEYLRQRTRESSGTLGLGGQNLASFIYEMSETKRDKLISWLKKIYPRLRTVHAKPLRSGWKQLDISEVFNDSSGNSPTMVTEARHINDGMLRMIAILAEVLSDNRFLLFDEIENGINPELIEFIVTLLVEANQQVLVTTHSPMILNYLNDEIAKKGVIYLYKTSGGATESIPFFSILSLAEKLKFMGPGEAFVDTNLTELSHEIQLAQEGN